MFSTAALTVIFLAVGYLQVCTIAFSYIHYLQESQWRRAFEKQVEAAQQHKYANELLLNSISRPLVARMKQEALPLFNYFASATIVIVETSVVTDIPFDRSLLALHDIFCVSLNAIIRNILTP